MAGFLSAPAELALGLKPSEKGDENTASEGKEKGSAYLYLTTYHPQIEPHPQNHHLNFSKTVSPNGELRGN